MENFLDKIGLLYLWYKIKARFISANDNITGSDVGKVVIWESGGKSLGKSEYTIGKSVPADALFTDTTYSDFGASGSGHSSGLVPDPGSTAGTFKYLCEDGTWKEVSTTDTTYKLTVNGTVNGDLSGTSLGTIYTPTSYGTAGLFLKSNGDNNAPTWDTPYSAGSNISITGNNNAINALGYSWDSTNSIMSVTGKINASLGFFLLSDIRKKTVLSDLSLEKAYDLIDKCQTIIYTLKDDKANKELLGLIAQEVKEFFPEIISEDENGMLSLDYSRLTVVILKVLKDLINRVSKLENYVNKN